MLIVNIEKCKILVLLFQHLSPPNTMFVLDCVERESTFPQRKPMLSFDKIAWETEFYLDKRDFYVRSKSIGL